VVADLMRVEPPNKLLEAVPSVKKNFMFGAPVSFSKQTSNLALAISMPSAAAMMIDDFIRFNSF